MASILISAMFAMAALFALTVITACWLHYGPVMLALRGELAGCVTRRDVRFAVTTIRVRSNAAENWRPGFSPVVTGRVRLPQQHRIWRAAA